MDSKSASRRLPPPCWSPDETVALIQVYRDKWYSLRRGNLRAPDWQEVADGVSDRCNGQPPKTSIQCRHKMEKLRKRYRSEIQRIGNSVKGYMCPSSWVHFKLMEAMELGTSCSDPYSSVNPSDENDEIDENEEEDMMLYPKRMNNKSIPLSGRYPGVRIKIPNFAPLQSVNRRSGSGKGMKRKEEDDDDGDNAMEAMVGAILKLGDGFVRMEKMKMDMAKELETMRMKTEIKRTEMILEMHEKMWGSFLEKKAKRVAEC